MLIEFKKIFKDSERAATSLQQKWNKTQKEINKFVGYLCSSYKEKHSGWSLDDYTQDAKQRYLISTGQPFKHESAYNVVKGLPKFEAHGPELPSSKRALNLDEVLESDEQLSGFSSPSLATAGLAKRPSMGKKRAKVQAFEGEKNSRWLTRT